jgi:ribonuclease BN (tRNA processing enzyme)
MAQRILRRNKEQRLMKIRVLGCSGAIAKDCRTTSFLVDNDLLVDAGTGVGDLTLAEITGINDVLITHCHLDHIAGLPLMIDAVASLRKQAVRVHALPQTIAALKQYIFNNHIWPDFTQIPSIDRPLLSFCPLQTGAVLTIANKTVEVLPAVHTVPAVGYAISAGQGYWVFSGDTERNPAFWHRLNQINVATLVIETAFSNREKVLAHASLHLSPVVLAQELDQIDKDKHYPIYITHTKPAETQQIMDEIQHFDQTQPFGPNVTHDIRWLRAGQELTV